MNAKSLVVGNYLPTIKPRSNDDRVRKINLTDATRKIDWIDIGVEGLLDFIPGLPKGDAILVRGELGIGKSILIVFRYGNRL